MLVVGMFDLGRIDNCVVRTNEGEEESKNKGDANGCTEGDPNSVYLKLSTQKKRRQQKVSFYSVVLHL